MTPLDAHALDLIRSRITYTGFAPTLREIGDHVGMSPQGAKGVVDRLVQAGRVRRTPGAKRGIELTDRPDLRHISSAYLFDELARRGETLEALSDGKRHALGSARSCAADSCGMEVERGQLMCRRHWWLLPDDLRGGILRAFSRGDQVEFQRLVTEARDGIDAGRWAR